MPRNSGSHRGVAYRPRTPVQTDRNRRSWFRRGAGPVPHHTALGCRSSTVAVPEPRRLINDEKLGTCCRRRTMRRIAVLGHLITHTGPQLEFSSIAKFGIELSLDDIKNVPEIAPVIRQIPSGIFYQAHAQVADREGAP